MRKLLFLNSLDARGNLAETAKKVARQHALINVFLRNMQVVAIIIVSILAAITYGVIHDQITARICVEYFTIGHPRLIDSDSPTVIGLFWGVFATWWVGLLLGIVALQMKSNNRGFFLSEFR